MSQDQTTAVLEGRLTIRDHGDAMDILFLEGDHAPLAARFEEALKFRQRKVSVRYFISSEPLTDEQRTDALVRAASGEGFGEYVDRYSDITGYLWTDEGMTVGGHDLLAELRSHVGQWCRLEVTIHA